MLKFGILFLLYFILIFNVDHGKAEDREFFEYENSSHECDIKTRTKRFTPSSLVSYVLSALRTKTNIDIIDLLKDHYQLPGGLTSPYDEYDFVIIGAGSAGCVLASRLSENPKWTVLLIEVGGPETFVGDVPLLASSLQHTDYNWGYRLEKMDGACRAMDEERCHWPKGRAVGGSSSINYMIYTRGKRIDWDRIAADGNPGWSYDEVLPYYIKLERAKLEEHCNSSVYGRDGPMAVEHLSYRTRLAEAFVEAGKELGYKTVDYNEGDGYGFGYLQTTTRNGRRHSAAKAFLHPFRNRTNLHVLPFSRATKIVIDKSTKTAKSVEYMRNGKLYQVKARKEFILSAGSISSPQLLMLSGVGPADHLKDLDIELIKDLPVGQNMYDHIGFIGNTFLTNKTGFGLLESSVISISNIAEWIKYGDGPAGIPGGVEALGYIKTKISDETEDYPDVEFIFASGGIGSDTSHTIRKGMKISDWFFNDVYGGIVGKESWSAVTMLLHPRSKGYIRLKDKNPYRWPRLYYDYFSDERDLLTMVEAIKHTIKLSKTKAFQRFGSRYHNKHYPTCKRYDFGTDEYWKCAVRTLASTLHHQIATCKMGPISDPEAIVDHRLKVHGIAKLRVADASIIPKPITAHTNAPSMMIGEKLADMLKNEHK